MIIPPKIARLPVIWELRKLTLYFYFTIIAVIKFKKISLIWDSFIYFPVWWKYFRKNNEPLKNDHPWIAFKAERFLRKILQKNMFVFEYGSGSSTLYFSRRVAKVFSVEHHQGWFEQLRQILDQQAIPNVDSRLIEPEILNIKHTAGYLSSLPLYLNNTFETYVKSIDVFPDGYFDLIMIDGRARTDCIVHAKNKIKQGGYLVVDNSERAHYFAGNDFLWDAKEWETRHFVGSTPYSFACSRTSFFKKI